MPTLSQLSPNDKAAEILTRLSKETAIKHAEFMVETCKQQCTINTINKRYANERLAYWMEVLEIIKAK